MVSKLSGYQDHIGQIHNSRFPLRTTTAHMERMIHNVESLSKTLKIYAGEPSVTNVKNVANEAGDILILLLALAHNVGFDLLVASSDRARTLSKEVNEETEVLKC